MNLQNKNAPTEPATERQNAVSNKADPHMFTLVSLASMKELIMEALQVAKATTIVEIGSEYGAFTKVLCERARKSGGCVITIDPSPQPAAVEFIRAHGSETHFQFLRKTSLEALPGLQADAYIIDGDHNYYTVRRELETIAANRGREPWLAILHDVCWPCARRDFYYNPATIPAEYLRPHSFEVGVAAGNQGVVSGGIRGCGNFAIALEEGGKANGVTTAVEDFLANNPDFEFGVIPLLFGLGIVYSRHAPWSESLSKLLAPWVSHPLLERIEAHRVDLALRVLELSDELARRDKAPAPPKNETKLPKSPGGLRLLATAYFIEQEWAEAGALFQTLVRHFPNDPEIWQARLECARQCKHHRLAEIILNDALRLHPEWRMTQQANSTAAAQAA